MRASQSRPYGRQMSDTYFYNRSDSFPARQSNTRNNTLNNTGPIERVQNGSLKHHCDNVNVVNETRYFMNRSRSEGNGSVNSGSYNGGVALNEHRKPRSENVVRFHEDVVTDVHVDYRDRIHVDEIQSEHRGVNGRHTACDNDVFELQIQANDRKRPKSSLDNGQPSREYNNTTGQPSNPRKESRKSRETKFVTDTTKLENGTRSCTQNGMSHSVKHENGVMPTKTKQSSNSARTKEPHRERSSSKSKSTASKEHKISKSDNMKHSGHSKRKSSLSSTRSSDDIGKDIHREGDSSGRRSDMNLYSMNKANGASLDKASRKYTGKIDLTANIDKTTKSTSKKKRKVCCLLLSLVVSVVIVVAMVTGTVLFIRHKSSHGDVLDSRRVYDMLNVHVKLRILNQNYTDTFKNTSSLHFTRFSVQLCNEVDVIYITSHMSQNYFGCNVLSLRPGSVRVHYTSPFLETTQTANVSMHREVLLNNLITLFSPVLPANTTVLGEFLVDVNSIEITFDRFQTTTLPPRPRMPVRVMTTTSTSSVTSESPDTTSPRSTTSPGRTNVPVPPTTTHSANLSSSTNSTSQSGGTKPNKDTKGSPASPSSLTDTMHSSTESPSYTDTSTDFSVTTTDMTGDSRDGSKGGTHANGNTGKPPGDKVPQHKTFITSQHDNVRLNQGPARIGFLINTTVSLASMTIHHRDFREELNIVKEVSQQELANRKELVYIRSKRNNMVVVFENSSVLVRIDFATVTCIDTGVYTCKVTNEEGTEVFADAVLNGIAEPSVPQLSLPIALIENKEIKKPIMCTADVGFPNGRLQWKIKPKGLDEFLPFDGNFISTSGECNNYVTSALIYTPTRDGNGTLLKCEVVNEYVPHPHDLTAVTDIYILPENMCAGIQDNKTIRHPSTCTKYIRCHRNGFEVKKCKNKMCYDEESARCGQTKLKMTDVVAYLNEGVTSLQCRLDHLGEWNNITISKIQHGGSKVAIASVISGGSDVMIYNTDMKDRIFVHKESSRDFEIKINLWLYVLTCTDEGIYSCEAYTPGGYNNASGRIKLRGKPEAPKLFVPNEVIEGLPLRQNVTCQANVGYPRGNLVLMMKHPNEAKFRPIKYNVTTEETIKNCSTILRKTFTFTPTLLHEKTKLLCQVENKFTLPDNKKLVAMETLHVVPKNFCLSHGSSTPRVHPYDCHQYVQCSEGYIYVQRCGSDHCFNPYTLHCDIEVEDTKTPFDPKHPCLPDKNGVFFHHPILCNKYIWCVQGQEVVHHCPLGTLYIDGGQCTFEPERSRCYQNRI